MPETYEFYFRRAGGADRLEVVTCRPEELMQRAQAQLDEMGADVVEVRQAGRQIFSLAR